MTFLVVPSLEKAHGTGHLTRSQDLVRSLRDMGKEAYLFAGSGERRIALDTSLPVFEREEEKGRQWDCIVLDRFRTPAEEFEKWSALGPVIGIDEGGPCRENFPFLIDLLPPLPRTAPANICDPSLLPLPHARRASFSLSDSGGRDGSPLRILVSFGGADLENTAIPACRALAAPGALITCLNPHPPHPRVHGVTFLDSLPDLREHLAAYDLVITHFGLTAFESIHARVPVLLVSPGAYHESLARAAGFVSAGTGASGIRRLAKLLYSAGRINRRFLRKLRSACEEAATRYGLAEPPARRLGDLLGTYAPRFPKGCPVCGSRARAPVISRFPDRTYLRCPACALVYMARPAPPPVAYERAYFFELYRNQYGKTYLEDFPSLVDAARARLDVMGPLLPGAPDLSVPPRILDIGCAYGPFLAAARERGYDPVGIDPTADAVRYVREELGLRAFHGFFPYSHGTRDFVAGSFDAVCLWYVIEHFEDLAGVFAEIRRLLKTGGVLSFATPSFGGVSARVSAAGFLEKSPSDHFTLWEPKHTAAILKARGFELRKLAISGHHPERFPILGGLFRNRRHGFLYRLFLRLSRVFRLGDTFEAHAVKLP
ncbi:MAG: methyltransferase domain-containing protein [Spirochaetaceae bacterium]|jgi:SAM-dependent methyltransferase|nr:methyltransferase domain-containing protein [Spirochaetaceae bacterium]